jgi:hypothetical protein
LMLPVTGRLWVSTSPTTLRKAFKKIHTMLGRELEKKFSGKVNSSFLFAML